MCTLAYRPGDAHASRDRDIRLVVIAAEAIAPSDLFHMPYAVEIQQSIEKMVDNLRESAESGNDGYDGWIALADSLEHRSKELYAMVAESFRNELPAGEQH